MTDKGLSLLAIFAHPDDEQLVSGTLARAASEGIRTGLICATRGEEGEISDPALATPDNLGKVREAEMRAAATVIGIKYLWFLDYRDSGMMGTEPNNRSDAFFNCDRREAIGKIVALIREFKPAVIVTFDPTGGYGHPDHVTINALTTEAVSAAGDRGAYPEAGEPWETARLYWTAFPRSIMARLRAFFDESGMGSGFADLNPNKYGMSDDQLSVTSDVSEWVHIKDQSLAQHRTQMGPNAAFANLPEDLSMTIRRHEWFILAAGKPLPDGDKHADDIFAGLGG